MLGFFNLVQQLVFRPMLLRINDKVTKSVLALKDAVVIEETGSIVSEPNKRQGCCFPTMQVMIKKLFC